MFVRKSDKDGSEGLLKGLKIAIERVGQKTPPNMDAIPGKSQDNTWTALNEGGS